MNVVDFNNTKYRNKWLSLGDNRFNGAYFYAREIVDYMIPYIRTDRNWILINQKGEAYDHSIVFIHNNLHPENYDWLSEYNDLILICGIPETCEKVKHLGVPLYLPLSVDIEEVKEYRTKKTKKVAFAGRKVKRTDILLPEETEFIENLPRPLFLAELAKYEQVYAVGRVAIEAKILGCEILTYDPRFPDPDIWEIHDARAMAYKLQKMLNITEKKLYDDAIERGMR